MYEHAHVLTTSLRLSAPLGLAPDCMPRLAPAADPVDPTLRIGHSPSRCSLCMWGMVGIIGESVTVELMLIGWWWVGLGVELPTAGDTVPPRRFRRLGSDSEETGGSGD